MTDILNHYEPITLDEMKSVRLMNRTDTKFVTTKACLRRLLQLAVADYRVQEVCGERISPYYTLYFDTPDLAMYRLHAAGHATRQKLRIRSYVHSGLNFLEVKSKNNHGRTHKERMTMEGFDPLRPNYALRFAGCDAHCAPYIPFLHAHLGYAPESLTHQLENHFNRITLVNRDLTERVTIDLDLSFDNLTTAVHEDMGEVVIIEIKSDGFRPSPIMRLLADLRIRQMGFSKYVVGSAITNPLLPHNRLKPNLRRIGRLKTQSATL